MLAALGRSARSQRRYRLRRAAVARGTLAVRVTPPMDGTRRSSFGFGSRSVAGIFDSERRLFLAVTLALGCLALLVLPFLRSRLGIDDALGGRPHDGYVEIARNLASGHGFVFEPNGAPVFHRPPLYPGLLAPIMLLPESWHRALVTLLDVL